MDMVTFKCIWQQIPRAREAKRKNRDKIQTVFCHFCRISTGHLCCDNCRAFFNSHTSNATYGWGRCVQISYTYRKLMLRHVWHNFQGLVFSFI